MRDLVHHPDYGLGAKGFAELLHGVFCVFLPLALHLVSLLGLAGPDWFMGVIADNGSAEGYALEMHSAMLNFGMLEDDRLEVMRTEIANTFMDLAVPPTTRMHWTRAASTCARAPNGLHVTHDDLDVNAFLLEGIESPYERLIVPLGGLAWHMSHARRSDAGIASFGINLMNRTYHRYNSLDKVLGHPGFSFSLFQLLSRAAASSDGADIDILWDMVFCIIEARPQIWLEVVSLDLLKVISASCSRTSPDGALEGTALAVGYLVEFAGHSLGDYLDMIGEIVKAPNTTVASLLFEQVDVPAILACGIDIDRHDCTDVLLRLLRLPNKVTGLDATRSLKIQCGHALANIGGWDWIWDVISDTEKEQPPSLFNSIVCKFFGEPEILNALAAPPTRHWSTQFVELWDQKGPLSDWKVMVFMNNLEQWSEGPAEMVAKLEAL
ncbi:hypothetical protein BC828DRAFT_441000 [Blastocladiella britannica]|nr:hypothetical protein BC828DRAFT_441000 [Blastocladiella britannica]